MTWLRASTCACTAFLITSCRGSWAAGVSPDDCGAAASGAAWAASAVDCGECAADARARSLEEVAAARGWNGSASLTKRETVQLQASLQQPNRGGGGHHVFSGWGLVKQNL
jgi:hypothetical protein